MIYTCEFFRRKNGCVRHFDVDCEQHEHSYSTMLFADAVAEAMIHRYETSSGVAL